MMKAPHGAKKNGLSVEDPTNRTLEMQADRTRECCSREMWCWQQLQHLVDVYF
jgi:hypothetical protein